MTAHTFVIFGASGDLAGRKLMPALYLLHRKGRLPEGTRVVGVARRPFADDAWRGELAASVREQTGTDFHDAAWSRFAENVFYRPGDVESNEDIARVGRSLRQLEGERGGTRVYYLATAPRLYEAAITNLGSAGLFEESGGPRRVVIEKPFGTDLASARALNEHMHRICQERQVYRIDHYLGKETVQNLLVLRFANSIFEPVWNRNYVEHVQITVAESVSVGERGLYYDTAGILRDMFQNHLLQLMMICAMEAPVKNEADRIRDEKVKVLRAVRRLEGRDVAAESIRGQYEEYANESGVPPGSRTATFAALRLWIDNWRWNGVPFYLRSGKVMSCRTTQIVIQFHRPPHLLFGEGQTPYMDRNKLIIQIQPAEGIQLLFQSKVPDAGMTLQQQELSFRFAHAYSGAQPDAYQRLLLDALQGDASLFARSDEVEAAWQIIDPILAAWSAPDAPPLHAYSRGEWGPEASNRWMADHGREWFDVCPVLD
jgi:glucose-6-phosphate 1-dehydrogenase